MDTVLHSCSAMKVALGKSLSPSQAYFIPKDKMPKLRLASNGSLKPDKVKALLGSE